MPTTKRGNKGRKTTPKRQGRDEDPSNPHADAHTFRTATIVRYSQQHVLEEDEFHQIVVNKYTRTRNESTPWHTDTNVLLKDSTEVLCISVGAPGIYCFQPNQSHIDELQLGAHATEQQDIIGSAATMLTQMSDAACTQSSAKKGNSAATV